MLYIFGVNLRFRSLVEFGPETKVVVLTILIELFFYFWDKSKGSKTGGVGTGNESRFDNFLWTFPVFFEYI